MADAILLRTGATKIDLAWAAGLFEGEGCLTHQRGGRVRTMVACLTMSDKDVVERFMAIVGVGNIRLERRARKENPKGLPPYKDLYAWRSGGFKGTQYIIALFWIWLGERRRNRAEELLKEYAPLPGRKLRVCSRGHDLTLKNARASTGDACRECRTQNSRRHYLKSHPNAGTYAPRPYRYKGA